MQKCKKHPQYKAKRKPTAECVECLEIWLALQTPRVGVYPTKKHKDKTKYSRKKKKESSDEQIY